MRTTAHLGSADLLSLLGQVLQNAGRGLGSLHFRVGPGLCQASGGAWAFQPGPCSCGVLSGSQHGSQLVDDGLLLQTEIA